MSRFVRLFLAMDTHGGCGFILDYTTNDHSIAKRRAGYGISTTPTKIKKQWDLYIAETGNVRDDTQFSEFSTSSSDISIPYR